MKTVLLWRSLSAHTISHYQRTERLYLKAWRKKPLNEINRQMVLKKHQNIGEKHGVSTNAATTYDIEWNGEELA
ncbi:MAG: site-specific integrase [Coraliomargarita sp.]|nr:site-specific integrase [Coraliomargarita sp.]